VATKLVALVLTRDEELHLDRCLRSVGEVATHLVVVDSGSTDRTLDIARSHGATVMHREWTNHAEQFNWALDQLDADTEWVIRIDADEYLTEPLISGLRQALSGAAPEIAGIHVNRRMTFQGRLIRHGGVFPLQVLRVFRHGTGRCEQRLMDEHIVVDGLTVVLAGELIDDNLKPLGWWTDKHNRYASLEAAEMLNLEFGFLERDSISLEGPARSTGSRRWLKEKFYARIPGGWRALVYFLYRYFFRLGFLDGQAGASFHFLQGFWYRYLVDAKVAEVKRYMRSQQVDIREAIRSVLDVRV
jgi:glycosyltransferase involved in cell wall biosynthesis